MEAIKLIEARVNVKSDVEKNHIVSSGAMYINETVNPADSWSQTGSPVQCLFTINPPSTQTIVDRNMKIRCYFEVETNQDLQFGVNDALRQYPISSLTDVLSVQINGENISDNVSDKLHAMLCYGNTAQDRINSSSTTPTMPDNYKNYSDWQIYGSGKSPLTSYGENAAEDPRGGFPIEIINARKFRVVLCENLLLSPFQSPFDDADEGFVNINQINISYRFKSNVSQILSHSVLGNNITTVSVTMYQSPEMLVTYLTPNLTQKIPQVQVLPYYNTQNYIKQTPTLSNNQEIQLVSDSIKLSQIPRKLYLFVRHERTSANQNTSDSFLRIKRLSILWGNQSGLFSSASEQDLYTISKKNGLNLSWSQWSRYRGGVLCLEFGKDIGLADHQSPGVQGQYSIQIQMTVQNDTGGSFLGEFFQVFLMEGTFSISENYARASLGNLSESIVLQAKQNENEISNEHYKNIQGGGFFSGLKNFVNKIATGIQSALPIAGPLLSMIPGAGPGIASALSAGSNIAKQLTGGRLSGGRLSGGRISRKSMKR